MSVAAAAVNPADLMMARGYYPGEFPPLPFVVGLEAAGRVLESDVYAAGTPVWWQAPGAAATHAIVPDERIVALPEEANLAVVGGLGIAGIAALVPLEQLARLGPGQSVLILGAIGSVGRRGVQIARVLGAGRIVAVLDPVWGVPAEAAVGAMTPGGRLITVGVKAGAEATAIDVLGRGLTVIGFDAGRCDAEVWTASVRRLVGLLVAGELELSVETMPLAHIAEAWERQAGAPRRKLVLVP